MSRNRAPAGDLIIPHNIDAEQALLGAILINDRALHALDQLQPEHFHDPVHQRIFGSMRSLAAQGKKVSPLLVAPDLGDAEIINGLTGRQYVARLAAEATTVINAPDYAAAIIDLAARRNIIELAEEMKSQAYRQDEESLSPREIVEVGMGGLLAVNDAGSVQALASMGAIADRLVDRIQSAWNNETSLGVLTGIPFIDELLGPLMPGHLIILGGESSAGKSALGLQIMHALARRQVPGLIFSMEMPEEEVVARCVAWESQIPASRIEAAAELSLEEMETIVAAGRKVSSIPWVIDATGKLSVNQIAARARRAKHLNGIGCILVDHLQFLRGDRRRAKDSKFDVIGEGVDDLKALAKELAVPIIVLSQLNRGEGMPKFRTMSDVPRPHMSRLYGASEIEKAADRVIFVHRPGYYLERMDPVSDQAKDALADARARWEGKAEIILAKRRGGRAPDRRFCRYVAPLMWFDALKDSGPLTEELPL